MRLIVGLGNPGPGYDGTRHNVGFAVADALAAELSGQPALARDSWVWVVEGELKDFGRLLIAKPQTYMNASGLAVERLITQHGVSPGEVVVVYDDLAIPLGRIRIRERGSAAGHNGLESILERLGTEDIPRLRFGIGPVGTIGDAAEFVLSRFEPGELPLVRDGIAVSVQALKTLLCEGISKAMSLYN